MIGSKHQQQEQEHIYLCKINIHINKFNDNRCFKFLYFMCTIHPIVQSVNYIKQYQNIKTREAIKNQEKRQQQQQTEMNKNFITAK